MVSFPHRLLHDDGNEIGEGRVGVQSSSPIATNSHWSDFGEPGERRGEGERCRVRCLRAQFYTNTHFLQRLNIVRAPLI